MRPILNRISSRKFIMAVLAACVGFVKAICPDFPEEALYTIVGALMGYVAIEGGIDAVGTLAKWAAERQGKRE